MGDASESVTTTSKVVYSPFDESGLATKEQVKNYREDEQIIVELLNEPLTVKIPQVDFVLVYYKYATLEELKRVKSYQEALLSTGLQIESYRDKDRFEPYMYTKLYIPFEILLEYSEFKYSSPEQYTSVQRAYAIESILLKTVIYSKINNEKFKRFDYRRMFDDGIYVASFVPHEAEQKAKLLQDWALFVNILKPQPIERIKNYFGGTIAIHFAWCQFYTTALLVATILSLTCYLVSSFTIHSEFEYPSVEVCAGLYDVYRRCPTCTRCGFTNFSDSCGYKQIMHKRSSLAYAFLMSIWISCLAVSFSMYLRKLTRYWEKPFNRSQLPSSSTLDFSNKRPYQEKLSGFKNYEPFRIDYLKRFPRLLKIYEEDYELNLDVIKFDEKYNFTLLDSVHPQDSNRAMSREEFIGHMQASTAATSEQTAILTPIRLNRLNVRTPSQTSLQADNEIELKFVEDTVNVKNQFYQALYSLTFQEALWLYLRRFTVGTMFVLYFGVSSFLYVFLLVRIKSIWRIGLVNSLLNLFFKYALHSRVVWYACKYMLPRTQSQFDRLQTILLTLCQLIEYSFFAYIAFWREFYFTDPGDLNQSHSTEPCTDDNCHLTMSDAYIKIVAMDQVTGLISSMVYPGLVNQFFGFHFPDPYISVFNRKVVYNISKWSKRIINCIFYPDNARRTRSFVMEVEDGRWLVDAMLMHDYYVRPNMVEYYLKVLGQLAYVTLFASNWFWAPFVIYLVTLVQTRLHAYHLLQHFRRAVPEKATKMLFWDKLLRYMTYGTIVTNALIYSVLSDYIPQLFYRFRFGTLKGYFNTTLSFYDAQKVIHDRNLNATPALDYCVYVGNKQPPWSDSAYTSTDLHSQIVCKRIIFLLLYFIFTNFVVNRFSEDIIWIFHFTRIWLDHPVNVIVARFNHSIHFLWAFFYACKPDHSDGFEDMELQPILDLPLTRNDSITSGCPNTSQPSEVPTASAGSVGEGDTERKNDTNHSDTGPGSSYTQPQTQ